MNDTNKERSHEWLLESGMFTTASSKSFLERTFLPKDFLLKLCVMQLASNPDRSNWYSGECLISPVQLNQICQRERFPSRATLLDFIRQEIQQKIQEERERIRVKKLVDWFGPINCLAITGHDDVGICPNKNCCMFISKGAGCSQMHCFCGYSFYWSDAKLNLESISKACHESGLTSKRELIFRHRLLKIAERIVTSAIASSKRRRSCKKDRPILQTENFDDIIGNVRYHRPYYSPRFEEKDEYEDPMRCDVTPRGSISLWTDESTSTHTPTDISFCDYIVVSGQDESRSIENQDEHWEDCSYSVVSGCDTMISLDDMSNAMNETTMLSYCKVTKLGISVAKRVQETSKEGPATSTAMASATTSPASRNIQMVVVDNLPAKEPLKKISNQSSLHRDQYGNNTGNGKGGGHDDNDDDDFLSIYDGAKSNHGGRASIRFRGNARTQRSPSGWGNQRRPNWSRKRRKEYKRLKSIRSRIPIPIDEASTVSVSVEKCRCRLCPQCGLRRIRD